MAYAPEALGALCGVCPLGAGGPLRRALSSDPSRPDRFCPVPPEIHPQRGSAAPDRAEMAAVGQQPGPDEEREGHPFAGPSGVEWTRDLEAIGRHRRDVDLFNVLACRCPGPASGAWPRMEATLARLNRARSEAGQEPLLHPAECCRPRLLAEVAPYRTILALGAEAYKALTGDARNILGVHGELLGRSAPGDPWRPFDPSGGGPLPSLRLVPAPHPAFVLRAPAWRDVLQREVAKAFRYHAGRLVWPEPETALQPTPEALAAWLEEPAPYWSFDVETDGKDPTTARIRCFSFSTPDLDGDGRAIDVGQQAPVRRARAIGVSLLSGDGRSRFYDEGEEARIVQIARAFLADRNHIVVGANVGYFDAAVVEAAWYPRRSAAERVRAPAVANPADLLLAARFRAPELPKGLKPNGRLFTDIGRWESDEKGEALATATGRTEGEVRQKDEDRVAYCCTDTVVGCRIAVPLLRAAREHGAFDAGAPALRPVGWPGEEPFDLWAIDHAAQRMCAEMHRLGVWVDQAARARLHREYAVRAGRRLVSILDQLEGLEDAWATSPPARLRTGFNPNSADQLRDLLYEHLALGMPPGVRADEFLTDSGLPSTSGRVLRAHLARGDLDGRVKRLLLDVMLFRRETTKVLGTTLAPLDPAATGSLLHPDGRVRSTWNAHVTAVGRLSSHEPNVQNQAKKAGMKRLRAVFAAAPGHVLVAGDLKQAHLRVIANTWRVASLRDAYLRGWDPYLPTAVAIFGGADMRRGGWVGDLGKKPPDASPAAALRQAAKVYLLAGLYAAESETKQLVVAGTEEEILDDAGRPTGETRFPYLGITAPTVARWDAEWHAAEPGWRRAWAECEARYAANGGWMRDPVLGRRSGCLKDGEKNDVCNYETLAAEGALMRLVEARVLDAFPFECDGPGTGLTAQTHDGLVLELADRGEGENARRRALLEECMTLDLRAALGWDVRIEAETSSGYSWADLG